MLQPKKKKQAPISTGLKTGIDFVQNTSKIVGKSKAAKNIVPMGSFFGLFDSFANDHPYSLSDAVGVVPATATQAASLMLDYAEKERENLSEFARKKMQGKDITKLKPKSKEQNITVKETISQTKPIVFKKKPKSIKNTQPVTSDASTKVLRTLLGTLMPDQAAQLVSAIATKDNKLGLQDLTPDIKEALLKSVKNAQKRTGKNTGGTEYIDYSSEVEKAFQGMSAGKKQMVSTNPDIQAATMLGRVSYKKNASGETEIYDSYDFSKTDPKKADSFYKKIRNYAGEALPDDGKKPNLIGKIPAEEELAFGTNINGIMKNKMNPRRKYVNGTDIEGLQFSEIPLQELPLQETPVQKAARLKAERQAARALLDEKTAVKRAGIVAQKRADFLKTMAAANFTDETAYIKFLNDNNSKEDVPQEGLEIGKARKGYKTKGSCTIDTKIERVKLGAGTGAKGINPNNYIVSPAEALNDYDIMMAKVEQEAMSNPWLPIVAAVGGAAQSFVGNAGMLTKKPDGGSTGGTDTEDTEDTAANGMNNVQADVEVEGGEMYETPQGQVGEFKGPNHEQGGIPLEVVDNANANPQQGTVQKETKVYSDQLMVGNKTLAERKATRERQIANLEKIASNSLVDQAVKNATKRKMQGIEKEEAGDLAFQDQVNNMQQMADTMVAAFGTGMAGLQDNPVGDSMQYGYGTGANGVMQYEDGTDMYGIDPVTGIKLSKAPTADMETNMIKNLHDILGIASTENGYGTDIGPMTSEKLKPYMKSSWVNSMQKLTPNSDPNYYGKLYDSDPKSTSFYEKSTIKALKGQLSKEDNGLYTNDLYKSLGLSPEGYKYLDPETPDLTGLKTPFVEPTGVMAGMEKYYQESKAKEAETKAAEKPTAMGNMMRSLPGMGDMTKLIGNYLGMTSGIKTAGEQRASDVTKTNVYKNAGEESQRLLDNAKRGIEISKTQAIAKASANTRTGMKGGRGARSFNAKQGMDWLYNTAFQQQVNEITANAAQQMSGIDVQKSGVAMNADQMKGTGEWQARMANDADKDAYFTALSQGRKDFATGMQQSGADLNAMKQNDIIANLMKGYGTHVTGDESGISAKNKGANKTSSKVSVTSEGGKTTTSSKTYNIGGKQITQEELLDFLKKNNK
jgi:hypothetical protein